MDKLANFLQYDPTWKGVIEKDFYPCVLDLADDIPLVIEQLKIIRPNVVFPFLPFLILFHKLLHLAAV